MNPNDFYDHYENSGFKFDGSILTRYCLSLYTKPFVILSGISGTGKTKIAQLFDIKEDEAAIEVNAQAGAAAVSGAGGFILMNVTQGILSGGRGNFKFSDFDVLFEPEEIPGIEATIAEKIANNDGGNIIDPVRMIIEAQDGHELPIDVYLQRAESPLVRVRFTSKRGDANPFDSSIYMRANYNLDDTLRLDKIAPGRLKITAVNDTAVIDAERAMEAAEAVKVDNKLFVSVKSNWTDSSELFGYYNMLKEEYQMTPFLRFIMQAHENPTRPFFVILDEMNLSKVEHYFSDFLSCLESRIETPDGVVQEPISLHGFDGIVNSSDELYDGVPASIELPTNLYVTGTVNIDETTYMFSPKVLDRSNVIEFNDVNIEAYLGDSSFSNEVKLTSFPAFGNVNVAKRSDFTDTNDETKALLKELIGILEPMNMHFGFRVINEISQYVNNTVQFVDSSEDTKKWALDVQVVQKILPKFSGSYGRLDEPLRKMIALLAPNSLDHDNLSLEVVDSIDVENSSYPLSLAKLIRMYKSILNNGFASYLE